MIKKLNHECVSNEIINALSLDGAVIIESAIQAEDLSRLQDDCNSELSKVSNCRGDFFGNETKRVGSMVGKSQVCQKLVLDTRLLSVMDHFLLPNCSQYQLNLSQLISIGSGEKQQIIHPDDPMFPFEHEPSFQVMINVMWAVDDFTIENGATHVVAGSHEWERDRHPEPHEVTQAEMSAGSCLIYLGSTRHGGGANRTLKPRRGLVTSYSLGWLKQSENHFLSISQEQAKSMPTKLQELIGYFVHMPNLNMVDGRDPIEILQDKESYNGFDDYIPEDVRSALKEFKDNQSVAIGKVSYS